MKKKLKDVALLTSFLIMLSLHVFSQNELRVKENFDFDWRFTLSDSTVYQQAEYDDSNWGIVKLPHDWSINEPAGINSGRSMGFYPGGIGWYRKTFTIPLGYEGKIVSIQLDGVYHQSDVYINDKHVGFHPYGYTTFEYDLTDHLNYGGANTIAVRVDHSDAPSSRWYSGSGIYRHVWLKVTNPVHVATWGTYITTPNISENEATVDIETTIENSRQELAEVSVQNQIFDEQGNVVAQNQSKIKVGESKKEVLRQSILLNEPLFWSIEEPHLYTMETTLKVKSKIVDNYKTTFGVRSIRFDANKGFFLNGENIKLKGMCLHPDAGSLGTAVPDKSYLRRLRILKEYGVNAIRCSHNPPSPEFLDMCDSLGFVVIDEAFDKWKSGYYSEYFDEWWKKDVEAMVLRDRNHPSIILWSIGNETREQDLTSKEGTKRAIMLRDYVHRLDQSRLVTAAIRPTFDRNYNKTGFAESLDIVGYNYQEPWLIDDKEEFFNRIMYISEAFPYYRGRDGKYKDFYPLNPWYDVAQNDFVFGQFIWAGIDYIGESTNWPSTGWPTGLFDVCMNEKPSAAFHRSVWNDEPMVRIAVADQSLNIDPGKPHWSWPFLAAHWNFPQYEGHVINVQTTTNCDEVELFLNDKSLGIRKTSDYTNNTITWNIPYEAGTLHAEGYSGEEEVSYYELKTSGKPSRIVLSADQQQILADGQDLSHITIQLVDEQGIPVPDADQLISVEIIGNASLIALDNGDLRVDALRKGNKIATYFGKALATVQAGFKSGDIRIVVKCDRLPEASLVLKSQ
ncbi:glycoside hydrolase family 2 TIM barrel-domain containing protein [Sunxiuqinia indica]|uniref:glycoside hydrolase family 2 TIM barrel-domain containing protein n=1 Tax=Sunxiuqinia indica TaxID=2692584 RepID=UPI001356AFAA|nr:glycoside hydrolase family 2 TIM barrel-domain containing protein [Sunxiuqinia indica]